MATPGQLIAETSRLLGLPENAVVTPWRVLREAGEVTTGGRGKHAAHVTAADAANLLVAIAADTPLKGALESWRDYSALQRADKVSSKWSELPTGLDLPTLKSLPKKHTLVNALTAIIGDLQHCSWAADQLKIQVALYGAGSIARVPDPLKQANIIVGSTEVIYLGRSPRANRPDFNLKGDMGDLYYEKSFSQRALLGLAQLLRGSVMAPAESEAA